MDSTSLRNAVQSTSNDWESEISFPNSVPDTDPHVIKRLWSQVYGAIEMSARSSAHVGGRRSREGTGNKGNSNAGKIIPSGSAGSLFDPPKSEGTPESTVTNSARNITLRNPRFMELVLEPRGIFINRAKSVAPSAFDHFGTQEPREGEMINYRAIPGLGEANIWVAHDDDFCKLIANEYRAIKGINLREEEFATFAKEYMLRGELRSRAASEDRQWRAERMLQLVRPPDQDSHWCVPPLMNGSLAGEMAWTWDIRPDCAYWLSLKGFNPRYRFQVQNCTLVHDWITCPYFTIEFKRDGEPEEVATRQVCAAGSIALFNRHSLYLAARKANSSRTRTEDMSAIRHYGMTFTGHRFVFWVLQPTCNGAGEWSGCEMNRLIGADGTDEYAVREAVNWINEIHRWGLLQHGPSCERDIEDILESGGVRTSSIH